MLRCNVTILLVAVLTFAAATNTVCTSSVAQSAHRTELPSGEYYSRPDLRPPTQAASATRMGNVSLGRPAPIPTLARPRSGEFKTEQFSQRALPGRLIPPGRTFQGRTGAHIPAGKQNDVPSRAPDTTLPPIMELRVASPGRALPPIIQSNQPIEVEQKVEAPGNLPPLVRQNVATHHVQTSESSDEIRLPEYQPPTDRVALSPSNVEQAITLTATPAGPPIELPRFNPQQREQVRNHYSTHAGEPIASGFDSMRINVSRATIVVDGASSAPTHVAAHVAAHQTHDAVPFPRPMLAAIPQQDPQTRPTAPPTSVIDELQERANEVPGSETIVDPFAHLPQNLALPREFPPIPGDSNAPAENSQPLPAPSQMDEIDTSQVPPKPHSNADLTNHSIQALDGQWSGSLNAPRQSWKSRTILPQGFSAKRFERHGQRWREALHRKRHQPFEQAFDVSAGIQEDCGCGVNTDSITIETSRQHVQPFDTNCCSSTFYLSVFGGYTQLEESSLDPVFTFLFVGPRPGGNLEVDDGFGIGVALGQIQGENLRSELEFSFRHNDISGFDYDTIPFANPQLLPADAQLDGSIESFSGMVNFVWDFQPRPWFNHLRPYAGGGIGFTFFDTRVAMTNGVEAVAPGFSTDSSFAYQLMAGISRPLRNGMDAFVEYRYFSADSLRLQLNLPSAVGGSIDYDTENIFFGIRKFF